MKAICWNASGINTKRALERLQTLKKAHNLSIIAIVEPFADQSHIAIVKLQLQMDQAVSNPNGKIWLFWSTNVTVQVLEKHDQHIIVTFQHTTLRDKFMMSFVYAKCKEYTRRSLWDRLLLYSNIDLSWCTIGDFNVITSIEEKLGGIPYNMNKSLEFIGVIEAYGLTDLGYTGLPYTWCNQRDAEARVWKRLNKSMVNDKWLENLPQTTIENLSSVGSDHSPLLMEMIQTNQSHTKYFKFLHCWVENGNFMITVQQCWDQVTTGHPMWKLHMKMNRLTSTLSKWSKLHGDIFTKVREFEKSIRKSEEELMTNNTEALRQKLHKMNATYIRYLKLEEAILQQKTQLHWFQEGDAHTKYFHALMRGRRRRLFLHKICIENEVWIQGEERIAQAACDYYQHQFTGQNDRIDERILQYIPTIITSYQNEMLQAIPNIDELRQVVFAMNPYSVGPDGFGGNFYQVCWNIIKEDLLAAVQLFFCGHIIPKFMSHACLVLIPKTEQPSRFAELRRISLSNFTNKIISKVLSMRLATVLPLLLSDNQLGFVRGRSITESIMLAQEISHAFKKPQIGSNVVIKLDMAKGVPDSAVCKHTESGKFSCTSAWEIYRNKKNITDLNSQICKVDTSSNSTYKLNTDGSALNNPGKIGGGGILRDSNGTIIYAFAIPLGEGTNNQVEIFDPSWRLNKFVQELQDIAKHCAYGHCVHTYREANSTTDLLSKQSHQHDIIQHYYTPNQLPKAAKEQQSTGMATTPPRKQLQPPDQAQSMRIPLNYKPQQGASSESSDNSSKLGRIEAIHIAISEEELDWARKIISLEQSGKI
ncbi:uncharacterized protein LOC125813529 [Solanum verrucosum]|uniref:uncharacterized protein LOC125813529 n=1 Tax=Solanum verrucosum TaxID=315347 RepID=UPI0020D17073|nr:uncharacterized protein LOC125813529 [Solanum verrucosum]